MTTLHDYLPSGQFSAMLGALLISSGLIATASGVTPFTEKASARLYASQTAAVDLSSANPVWQDTFADDTVPHDMAAIQNQANEISQAVQGKNLTDSIGKTLLIQMASLQGQGIADSSSAQAEAAMQALQLAQSQQKPLPPTYAQKNLVFSSNSQNDLRTYGNILPTTIERHPKAASNVALYPIADAVDRNSGSSLYLLKTIAAEYRALAADVIKLPTPPMLAPYSVALANNYMNIAVACEEMAEVHSDPLRGMLGLQNFAGYNAENAQILYQIGSTLKNSGIVFAGAEPGAVWSRFITMIQQATAQ